MNYLLDTNILIHIIRNSNKELVREIKELISDKENSISIVTLAEVKSFASQNNWGNNKISLLENIIENLNIIPITDHLVHIYVKIDTFSQGKHQSIILDSSAKNMGKNDLWISATAKYNNLSLITTDNDFNHLDPHFIKIINLSSFP